MNFTRASFATISIPVQTMANIDLSPGMKILLAPLVHPGYGTPGNKILAIKAIRAEFACGLKEAKDIVEGLTREHLGVIHTY